MVELPKISKGAHTIVNANEAMLLITGGSGVGGQIFSEIFYDVLRAFLKIFLQKNVLIYAIFSVAQIRNRHPQQVGGPNP